MPNRGLSRHSPAYRKMFLFVKHFTAGMLQWEAVFAAGYKPGGGHCVRAPYCDRCKKRATDRGQWLRSHSTVKQLLDQWLVRQKRSDAEVQARIDDLAWRDPANGFRGADVVAALALTAKTRGMVRDRTEVTGADGTPLRIAFPALSQFDDSPVVQTTALPGEVHELPAERGQAGLLGRSSARGEGLDRAARHLPDDGGET